MSSLLERDRDVRWADHLKVIDAHLNLGESRMHSSRFTIGLMMNWLRLGQRVRPSGVFSRKIPRKETGPITITTAYESCGRHRQTPPTYAEASQADQLACCCRLRQRFACACVHPRREQILCGHLIRCHSATDCILCT